MPTLPIVDTATVLEYGPSTIGQNVPLMDRCILAVTLAIERRCGRRFARRTYDIYHSGTNAGEHAGVCRSKIWLGETESGYSFLTLPVSAVSSLTEDGVTIPVKTVSQIAAATDGAVAVLRSGAGEVIRGTVSAGRFSPCAWASGYANIHVQYTAGFVAPPAADADMPEDIVQACCAYARKVYLDKDRAATSQIADSGVSMVFMPTLDRSTLDMIDSLRFPSFPRSWED